MKVTEDREKTFYEPADMVGLHEETVVTEDADVIINAPTKPVSEDCDKIFEALTEVDKDSEEYKRRLKEASNRFLAASGKLDVTCPLNIHSGYSIYDCKCQVNAIQSRSHHRR
jgi:hypothetical protein